MMSQTVMFVLCSIHLCNQLFYPLLLVMNLTDKILLLLQQAVHRLPQL